MNLRHVLLGAVLAAAILPGAAFAAGPAIDWDPAYAWQAGGTPTNLPVGGEFKMVGTISQFNDPFSSLHADDPTREYTFYVHGLISQGTTSVGSGGTIFYTTQFTGGTIEIYEDLTPDASFTPGPPVGPNVAGFTDGALLLAGSFTSFTVESNNFTAFKVGNIEGQLNWTGGSLLPLTLGPLGVPCPGLFTGGSTWNPSVLIPGYLFRHDGKIDLQCPTPTRGSSWGRIKSLYH